MFIHKLYLHRCTIHTTECTKRQQLLVQIMQMSVFIIIVIISQSVIGRMQLNRKLEFTRYMFVNELQTGFTDTDTSRNN